MQKKILVHVHVYYHEQVDYIISKLQNITDCNFKLFVTYSEENKETNDKFLNFSSDTTFIKVYNLGYDILPFITVLQAVNLDEYDYILKLHTKNYRKKTNYRFYGKGFDWRNLLFDAILSSKKRFKTCLKQLEDKKTGMIGSGTCIEKMSDKVPENCELFNEVCERFNVANTKGHFIAGTMFLVKADLFKMVQSFDIKEGDFKPSFRSDSSEDISRAMERLFGVLVERQGYKIKGPFNYKLSTLKFLNLPAKNIFIIKNEGSHKVITILGLKIKFKKFKNQTKKLKAEYTDWLIDKSKNGEHSFVDFKENMKLNYDIQKLIAFYLPQFHTFKENDEWHGRGFSEWTNVTKSIPRYTGHHQPQLPIDVGFYDLSTDKVMYRQIELAKNYGIYGFCFHYYWFSGKRLMETPIFNFLNNKNLDMPFCLCWANENWSKLWDGGNKEVLMEQKLQEDDGVKFINDIMPFFKDERYIKKDNKPVLIIYRPQMFGVEKFKKFVSDIKQGAINEGFDGIYLIMVRTCTVSPFVYNMDAGLEFPPLCMHDSLNRRKIKSFQDPNFIGNVFDMSEYILNEKYFASTDYPLYKGVFPAWDNSARKAYTKSSVYETSPKLYKTWLKGCIEYSKENNYDFIFINAWNEWAEGAHLEPDQKYGYAYLQATYDALYETRNLENHEMEKTYAKSEC